MFEILDNLKRLSFRVQPVSQLRKREKRREEQEKRDKYYRAAEYIRKVRKDLGYGKREWSA